MDPSAPARHDGTPSALTHDDDEVVPPAAHLPGGNVAAGSRTRPPFSASSPNVAGTNAPTAARRQSKRRAAASSGIPAPAAASLPEGNPSDSDTEDDDASSIGDCTEDEDEGEDEYESEDEDEADGIADDTDDTDYAAFIMQIGGESIARELVKPFCIEASDVIVDNGFYFNPLGPYVKDLKKRRVTKRCGHYTILNEDLTAMESIGMSSNLRSRRNAWEKKGVRLERFCVIVEFDSTNDKVDAALQDIYRRVLDTLASSAALHPFQRFLVELLRERQGDRLGPKRQLLLQLIETGLQLCEGLPSTQEFLMFDRNICNHLYALSENKANLLVQKMPTIRNAVASGKELRVESSLSWKPGHDSLSSTRQAAKCMLGEGNEENATDPIPYSAIQNPKTTAEVFSDDYTRVQKAGGRVRFDDIVATFLLFYCGILFVDTNKIIFGNDPHYRPSWGDKSVVSVLINKFGFRVVHRDLGGEIVMLLDETDLHAAFVHYPLHVSSCSRVGRKMISRVRRTITLAVLTNVPRLLRGDRALRPEDKFRNPINAILAFQVMHLGFHQSARVCAAFSRDCYSDADTFALVDNQMPKSGEGSDAPIVGVLRALNQPCRAWRANIQRPINRLIVNAARCTISVAQLGSENEEQLYQDVIGVLGSGDVNPTTLSSRWIGFLKKNIVAGSELETKLETLRDSSAKNKGNRASRKGVPKTNAEIADVSVLVRELVRKHGPTGRGPGAPFWIRANARVQIPENRQIEFPGKHPAFFALTHGGLENRCKPNKNLKGTTKAATVDSLSHLKLSNTKPNKQVTLGGSENLYTLVQFHAR